MPTINGVSKLNKALEALQSISTATREALEEKRDWILEKSEAYQESDAGQEWYTYLDEVENLLDEIDGLTPIEPTK